MLSSKTHEDLKQYLDEKKQSKRMNCLFIDEIQEIAQFELVLRELNSQDNWDIYITGSNANILSRDLATLLSGRCIEIEVHPLTYKEFLTFHKRIDSDKTLTEYIKFGGLPYLLHLELDEDVIYDYLKNILPDNPLPGYCHSTSNQEYCVSGTISRLSC